MINKDMSPVGRWLENLEKEKTQRLVYFFLDGKIHKSLHISRARDEIVAWCYPEKRRVMYNYSLVKNICKMPTH
jgi:hypothetical protein